MRDDRREPRLGCRRADRHRASSTSGRRSTELGRSRRCNGARTERLLLSGGARFDWVRFSLADNFLADGDDSGDRTMSALSGNIGASWSFERSVRAVRQRLDLVRDADDHRAGEPAGRVRRVQPGARAAARGQLRDRGSRAAAAEPCTYSVALFLGRVTDAIVQQEEVGGRAFFRNAGKTHNDGAEIGLSVLAGRRADAAGRVHLRALSVRRGAEAGLDGNRLPGVPDHFWRFGLRTALAARLLPGRGPHARPRRCRRTTRTRSSSIRGAPASPTCGSAGKASAGRASALARSSG